MKTRIATACIGIVLFIGVLLVGHTVVLDMAVMVLIMIAMWEIFSTMGYLKNRILVVICFSFGISMPLFSHFEPYVRSGAVYILITLLFCCLLYYRDTMSIEHIGAAFLFTYFLPLSLSTCVSIRLLPNGEYLIYLAFMIPWLSDSCAYFFGKAFGKKKLCPNISPNKTVVGGIAGLLGGGVLAPVAFGVVMKFIFHLQMTNFAVLVFCCLLCALISEIGDLSASIIKRKYNVKDFGNLFPGHGGVMDRFDSVIFVMPLFYTFLKSFEIILR